MRIHIVPMLCPQNTADGIYTERRKRSDGIMSRVRRDLVERKRDVLHVLEQYERTVKPSFAQFILPTKQFAHIIVSFS